MSKGSSDAGRMKLLYTTHSFPSRKVLMVMQRLGLARSIALEWQDVSVMVPNPAVVAHNPLGQIPVLLFPDGRKIVDSTAIVACLQAMKPDLPLLPDGDDLIVALEMQGMTHGLMHALYSHWYEYQLRPADRRWPAFVEAQFARVPRFLDFIEAERADFIVSGRVDLGTISMAMLLEYLATYHPEIEAERGRPRLSAWWRSRRTEEDLAFAADPAGYLARAEEQA